MLTTVALLSIILPTLVTSSGEGNIHLLEDEVATALRSCAYNENLDSKRNNGSHRKRRSDIYHVKTQYGNEVPRIDHGSKSDNMNVYGHERRNSSVKNVHVSNGTERTVPRYNKSDASVKYVTPMSFPSNDTFNNITSNLTRSKRSNSLINIPENQCLSQCVFANLQVVDARGIPRETDFWNKIQTAVTSQQSRTLLKDQIRACFQELHSDLDAEEDGCAYSNRLERCLMLRFSERKPNTSKPDST